MKFLLTNDDGIKAPGLAMLAQALSGLGKVVVVAPTDPLSGCSHQVITQRPLQVTEIAAGWHAVDGTPADCIRLGLLHLAPDVDWVMAGINDGGRSRPADGNDPDPALALRRDDSRTCAGSLGPAGRSVAGCRMPSFGFSHHDCLPRHDARHT